MIGIEDYECWEAANILNRSVFDALSTGSGSVVAVVLCVKRGVHLLQSFIFLKIISQ
jgi:hypothetical protein